MSDIKTGGPAFPSHGTIGEVAPEGMTLRDYFAAKAMQGFCVNRGFDSLPEYYAKVSYSIADAMIAARDAQ